jgi:P-type E1-E2 ATPase
MGAFDIADTVRDDAGSVVERMKRRGIRILMLTGDSRQAASRIFEKLNGM